MSTNGGTWVTIKGTHIFIKDGETFDEAVSRLKKYDEKKRENQEVNEKDLSAIKKYVETGASKLTDDEFERLENLSKKSYKADEDLVRISYVTERELSDMIDNSKYDSNDIDFDYPEARFQDIDIKMQSEWNTDLYNEDYDYVPVRSFAKKGTSVVPFSIADRERYQVPVKYIIPKGTEVQGFDISKISRIKQENEVLLNKKQVFKVTKLRFEDNEWKIYLRK